MDLFELKEAYKGEKDSKVKARMLMMIKLKEGLTAYQVAKEFLYPQSNVVKWKKRFKSEGIKGLSDSRLYYP
ncbi:MAG: helix-turn-helix domain-containing protein [Candidatus Bathyarchaeia archaeon]